MKTIANNPAYPVETADKIHVGMSCRAVTATAVLNGLLSGITRTIYPDEYFSLAAQAVDVADALIAELEATRK